MALHAATGHQWLAVNPRISRNTQPPPVTCKLSSTAHSPQGGAGCGLGKKGFVRLVCRAGTSQAVDQPLAVSRTSGAAQQVDAGSGVLGFTERSGSSERELASEGTPSTSSETQILENAAQEDGDQTVESRQAAWRQRRKPRLSSEAPQVDTLNDEHVAGRHNPEQAAGRDRDEELDQGSRGERESESNEEEEEEGEGEEEELEPGYKMVRVCDRLIDVFWVEKTAPDDWRKLLAYSEEWGKIRPHFFRRCEARAKDLEPESPGKAAELFKLARRLKEVDNGMILHSDLLELVMENQEELDGIVARRRKDFMGEFFEFLRMRCEASFKDINTQEALVTLANKILTSVETHDRLMQDEVSVEAAQAKFDDIMGSGTLEEACGKIDALADRQQLDSTLMLMITKAWAAAKESNMMKDEVKDVMHHLYMQALANMRMLVPKEVRILRHVLSLEDPREMFAALTAAFSPGDEIQIQNAAEDYLFTTPDDLLAVVDQVLNAYYANRENTLIEEAKKLMSPAIIKQLEILKKIIIDEFK